MSNAVFPGFLGLGYAVHRSPTPLTALSLSASGKEVRIARYSLGRPLWEFMLTFSVLNRRQRYPAIGMVPVQSALIDVANLVSNDVAALEGFFLARQGRYDSWLFEDPRDCAVALQQIGIGTGSATAFQITRQRGEFLEDVTQPNGTPVAASTWQPNTLVAANALVIPTTAGILTQMGPIATGWQSSGWPVYFQCTSPGRTGLIEPRWRQLAPLAGLTLTDGNVTWTCQGAPLVVYVEKPLPDWASGTAYALGAAIKPLTGNAGGFTFLATVGGTSAGAAPVWPQTLGATVADNTVTWTNYGVSAVGVNNPIVLLLPSAYSLGSAGLLNLNTAPLAGQQVFVTTSFFFRCRFKEDLEQFETFMDNFTRLAQLKFQSIKV